MLFVRASSVSYTPLLVPVSLEVQYVRNYLLLLKARFEDRLSTDIEAGDDVSRIMIPKLAIFTPVSYTHLDVYKRQGKNDGFRRAGNPAARSC